MYSLSTKFNQLCELWCANALQGYYIPEPTTIGRKRFYSLQLCAGYARTKHFECSRHFAFRLERDPPFHAPDTLIVTRNKTPKTMTSNEKNIPDNSNTDKRDCANGTKRTTTTTTAAARTAMWATTAITITTPAPTTTATPIHYFVGTPERLNHSLQNYTPKSFQLMWFVVSKCFQWRPYC